jgi:L-seryl-tRNA(Ser) seleniumtransferase
MTKPDQSGDLSILRQIPSIDELIGTETGLRITASAGHKRTTAIAREVTEEMRAELRSPDGDIGAGRAPTEETILERLAERLESAWEKRRAGRLRRVINATGVIVHTNLGRSPLSEAAVGAISNVARGYCTIEYDLESGKRGRRGGHVEDLLAQLTGAEAALVVNNCAAAAFLTLKVFAAGKEVIVSRGELVEIGGDFRVPDVLAQSGAVLREIGTTNRTKVADYQKAISENTAMILKVHPSNYRIVGFTEAPPLEKLASLARQHDVLLYEDAGSGALLDLKDLGLADEPVIERSIADGADLVTFSGDKLLGGPQAGIIVGRLELIDRIRRHPLYRALRVDKLVLAALEATLESFAREAVKGEIPVLTMLHTSSVEMEKRSRAFVSALRGTWANGTGPSLEVVEGSSAVGGGAGPDFQPDTWLVALTHPTMSASEIEAKLRLADPPVITRIADGKVLLDLRTVSEPEIAELRAAISNIVSG